MHSLNLGPLALPVAPLLWLGAIWLALAVAERVASRALGPAAAAHAGRVAGLAALLGLAVARLAFVAAQAPAYAAQPWSVLDIRDGGWAPGPGLAAAAAWLAWQAWRHRPLARALGSGVAAGLLAWTAGHLALAPNAPVPLPSLVLKDLAGQATPLRAADTRQPQVINLWASWCPPCREEMPVLAQAQARLPQVQFLFVNQGESAETVRRFLQQQPAPVNGLHGLRLDEARELGRSLGAAGLPTTLFVNASGQVVHRHLGPLTAAALQARLAQAGASSTAGAAAGKGL